MVLKAQYQVITILQESDHCLCLSGKLGINMHMLQANTEGYRKDNLSHLTAAYLACLLVIITLCSSFAFFK